MLQVFALRNLDEPGLGDAPGALRESLGPIPSMENGIFAHIDCYVMVNV